jgi:hypothetical protein
VALPVIAELKKRGEWWFWSLIDSKGRDLAYVVQTELVLRHTDIAMLGDLSILEIINQTQGGLDAQKIRCQTQI